MEENTYISENSEITEENSKKQPDKRKYKKFYSCGAIVIYVLIIEVILLFIFLPPTKSVEILDCDTMCCIGNNSILVASKGCSHCEKQIKMLGDEVDEFNIIYCSEDIDFCTEHQIMRVPTWIINDEQIIGVQSLEELKEMTNC